MGKFRAKISAFEPFLCRLNRRNFSHFHDVRTMAVASIHTIDLLECRSTEHCRDLELVVEQPETLPYDSHASDDDDDDVDVVALHLCYLHTE